MARAVRPRLVAGLAAVLASTFIFPAVTVSREPDDTPTEFEAAFAQGIEDHFWCEYGSELEEG
jgi:hypothetical protein